MRIFSFAFAALVAWPLSCALAQTAPEPSQDVQAAPATPPAPGAPRVIDVPHPAEVQSPPPVAAAPGNPPPPPSAAADAAPSAPLTPLVPRPPPGPPSHYAFNRVDNGYLRLDNQTGQVAFCSAHSAGWACEAVPEDRAALEKEIARLQDEIARLKADVAVLTAPPPPPRPPADLTPPPPPSQSDDAAKLREDLARARVAFENAWRMLVEMLNNFQKDMMRKG